MPTCHVHGCELVPTVIPIRYGYAADDGDLGRGDNPYHGQYELGGCVITPDSPNTQKSWVYPVCSESFQAAVSGDATSRP